MDSLPFTLLDLGVAGVLLVGGLVGLLLGFIKGGLILMSWIGAISTTYFGIDHVRPYARQYIVEEWMADLAGGGAIFLVTLVALFLLSSVIGSWVRGSRLNALDRSLGMLAGISAGTIIVASGFLVYESVETEPKRPAWVAEARTLSLIKLGADYVKSALPELAGAIAGEDAGAPGAAGGSDADDMVRKLLQPKPRGEGGQDPSGYSSEQRQDMERLIRGSSP